MKRFKRRVKEEKPETSTAREEEHDLAYYIHDRVELMHQVFSILKPKELKTIAPESIRHISIDDLQELCTEELLGISSKRLCAILDGAQPPSDTESSSASPERMETISLDSISSDEEILSQSSKKKKKHKRHSKSKKKDKKATSPKSNGGEQQSRASRAGLTVLELLELQARARAIRAQLHQEQAKLASTSAPAQQERVSDDDDEAVLIKEEPTLVVEISSDEDKPDVAQLEASLNKASTAELIGKNSKSPPKQTNNTQSKVVDNLVITMPQQQQRKRIKLNRNKSVTENNSTAAIENSKFDESTTAATTVVTEDQRKNESNNKVQEVLAETNEAVKKIKKTKKKKQKEKDGSDHDEITLQLSDSEKIDLLEHFEDNKTGKKWPNYHSSSEDSDSSSSESSDTSNEADKSNKVAENAKQQNQDTTDKVSKQSCDNTVKEFTNVSVSNNSSATETLTQIIKDKEVRKQSSAKSSTELEEVKIEMSNIELGGSKIGDKTVEEIETSIENNLSISEGNLNTIVGRNVVDRSSEVSEPMEVDESPLQSEEKIEITSVSEIPILEQGDTTNQNVTNSLITKEQNSDVRNKKTNETQHEDIQSSDLEVISIQKQTLRVVVQGNNRSVESKAFDVPLKSSVNVVSNESKSNEIDAPLKSVDGVSNDSNVPKLISSEKTENKAANRSDGEVSNAESSEIEAVDLQPDVVCISDEESNKDKTKKKKKDKSKKKEKKAKKDKKKKSKSDFREAGDENFFTEKQVAIEIVDQAESNDKVQDNNDFVNNPTVLKTSDKPKSKADSDLEQPSPITINEDDIYEILELSDDSSCYEVEGVSVLSKEPTADEIAAFSARIDEEFEQDNIDQIKEHINRVREKDETDEETNDIDEIVKISWKDRYLGSKKVKQVLTTSNILNAMRKKNIELKKRIEQSKRELELQKQQEIERQKVSEEQTEKEKVEGTIKYYNTLVGSTKYVDPVPQITTESKNEDLPEADKTDGATTQSGEVTREMKKDAKQLLKMYKRLLKYNDMTKEKDPNKKKKKKSKKSKEKLNSVASSEPLNNN